MEWLQYGSCRGMDVNDFMPIRGDIVKIRAAKKICNTCPVMFDCRKYGLSNHRAWDLHGIFGGLTRMEREDQLRIAEGRLPKNRKVVRKNDND